MYKYMQKILKHTHTNTLSYFYLRRYQNHSHPILLEEEQRQPSNDKSSHHSYSPYIHRIGHRSQSNRQVIGLLEELQIPILT